MPMTLKLIKLIEPVSFGSSVRYIGSSRYSARAISPSPNVRGATATSFHKKWTNRCSAPIFSDSRLSFTSRGQMQRSIGVHVAMAPVGLCSTLLSQMRPFPSSISTITPRNSTSRSLREEASVWDNQSFNASPGNSLHKNVYVLLQSACPFGLLKYCGTRISIHRRMNCNFHATLCWNSSSQ